MKHICNMYRTVDVNTTDTTRKGRWQRLETLQEGKKTGKGRTVMTTSAGAEKARIHTRLTRDVKY